MKGLYNLDEKFNSIGIDNCFISEITLAELKFGVENSAKPEKNRKVLDNFLSGIKVLPIFEGLDICKRKIQITEIG